MDVEILEGRIEDMNQGFYDRCRECRFNEELPRETLESLIMPIRKEMLRRPHNVTQEALGTLIELYDNCELDLTPSASCPNFERTIAKE